MDKEKIKSGIDNVIAALVKLKESIDEPVVEALAKQIVEPVSDFEQLKKLLESDKWPETVNKHLICDPNNDEDKAERGRGIIELMIEERMPGIKFLDFGCGEGHAVQYAAQEKAALSVGYDVKGYDWVGKYGAMPNLKFTTDFDTVIANGPYDVILLFDVIDHTVNESAVSILKKVESVLSPTGKVYMRTHPFTSRHATHLYHHLNKAYLHLIFSEEELKKLIPEQPEAVANNGPTLPLMTYKNIIKEAGLKEVTRREIKEPVEAFFKTPVISKRILETVKMKDFPEFQMSLQFVDYVLGKQETESQS